MELTAAARHDEDLAALRLQRGDQADQSGVR